MRNPQYYFINCFDSKEISVDKLAAFATDHIGRLTAQNGSGEWTARIAATTAAMTAFDDAISDDLIKGAFRASRKDAKDGFRETLPAEVGKILNFVRAHFGEGSPEVIACAPDGLKGFRDAPDDKVENHLTKLIAGVTDVQATVGAAVVTQATDLKAAWMTIYLASEDSTSDKAMTEAEQRTAKLALQDELFTTLLALASKHRNQPEMLGLYMQPHLA
ncbi:MAG: hypothetical protein KDL87_18470, partial [Verrucomicrobiae bacterium]|nr:hypothetical protein [Verrucomicrobiae bacterium]